MLPTGTVVAFNFPYSSLETWVTIIPDSLDNGNVTFELNETNFIMLAGSNADVILTAKASGSATPGSYSAELEIKSEIPVTPPPIISGGGDGSDAPLYSIKTNLFGVEKTYYTESDGDIYKEIEGASQDGNLTITIPRHTTGLVDGKRLRTLDILIDETPPDPPEDTNIIGLPYNFLPAGATFEPPIIFTWSYDPDNLPEGVDAENLVLAYYIDGEWVELECVVDTATNTVTASVSHFTTFALLIAVPRPIPTIMPTPVSPTPAPIPTPAPPVVVTPEPAPVPIIPPAPEPEAPVVTPPVVPPAIPEAPTPWGLIIGLICAAIIVGLGIWWYRKQKAKRGY